MFFYSKFDSPVGVLTLVSSENKLVGLEIENQKYFLTRFKNDVLVQQETAVIMSVQKWLESYFVGEKRSADKIPVDFIGSEFQISVWNELRKIPYGTTMTYGQIAKIIAHQKGISCMSAQAIGQAVGRNPISILVPCHRVVGSSGKLTGYAGGLEVKKYLLDLEQK